MCFQRYLTLLLSLSSFFVQAKTAQSVVTGNVFFNGPRAGINANDGFGGGDEISHNLVFSTCRESGDHGPFNSWDRQVVHGVVLCSLPCFFRLALSDPCVCFQRYLTLLLSLSCRCSLS